MTKKRDQPAPAPGITLDTRTAGIALALLIQFAAGIWWGAGLDHRLDAVEDEQDARAELRGLPAEFRHLSATVDALSRTSASQHTAVMESIAAIHSRVETLSGRVVSIADRMDSLDRTLATHAVRLDELDEDLRVRRWPHAGWSSNALPAPMPVQPGPAE